MVDISKVLPKELDPDKQYVVRARSLNAFGVPSEWSNSIVIDTSLVSGAEGLITQTDNNFSIFNDDGELVLGAFTVRESRINRVINPSFELNTNTWAGLSNSNLVKSSTYSFFGASAARIGPIIAGKNNIGITLDNTGYISVIPGEVYTTSAHVYRRFLANLHAANADYTYLDYIINYYDLSNVLVSTVKASQAVQIPNNAWTRIKFENLTVPTGVAKIGFTIKYSAENIENLVVGEYLYFDGMMVEQNSLMKPYFDGDTVPGRTSWDGADDNSESIFDNATTNSVYIRGEISADTGVIGGWTIDEDTLRGGTPGVDEIILDASNSLITLDNTVFLDGGGVSSDAFMAIDPTGSPDFDSETTTFYLDETRFRIGYVDNTGELIDGIQWEAGTGLIIEGNIPWDTVIGIPNPTITVNGDASGSVTLTNLENSTLTLDISSITGNLTVSGDLTIGGTTTTINSTVFTADAGILTLGGDTNPSSDDNKDRGIEYRWYSGSAKRGFFGFDDSTGKLTFIPDATNTAGVFSGTKGEIDATLDLTNLINWQTTLDARYINTAGDTMTGQLVTITPVSGPHAANKQYVDDSDAALMSAHLGAADPHPQYLRESDTDNLYVNILGDSMLGALFTLTPTTPGHAANKAYVDTRDVAIIQLHESATNPHPQYLQAAEVDAAYVAINGDTMTGELDLPRLGLLDSNSTHYLKLKATSDLTANRQLSIATGDANRTLTLTGNGTLNQDVSTTGSPTFANLQITQATPISASDVVRKDYVDAMGGGLAAHVAAPDPHPQYLLSTEGDIAYVNVSGDTMTGTLSFNANTLEMSDGIIALRGAANDERIYANATALYIRASQTGALRTNASGANVDQLTWNNVTGVRVHNALLVDGNLTVQGTTTTVNSAVTTIMDPILTLGGSTPLGLNDGKDRGVEFRYYSGSSKLGFMGWDNSANKFTVLTDVTNASEVMTGTVAEIVAKVDFSNILNYSAVLDSVYVNVTGDTMTGALSGVTPASPAHLTRKDYVDAADALRVSKTGDTMTGDLIISKASATIRLQSVSGQPNITFHDNVANRWRLLDNITTGSLQIDRFDTGGVYQNTPWAISTAGVIVHNAATTINGTTTVNGAGVFQQTATPNTPLYVRAMASQTGALTRWESSGGTMLSQIGASGGAVFADLAIRDSAADNWLYIRAGSNLSADRVLTFTTGDVSRTVTLDGDVALNQNLRTNDSPGFVQVTASAASPTSNSQLTRKDYVDSLVSSITTSINDHIADPTNAHMATAIGFSATPPFATWLNGTNVQTAIIQTAAEIDGRISEGDTAAIINALNAWTIGDPQVADPDIFQTDLIIARHIAAGSVIASKILAGVINTSHMTAGTIDADRLDALSTITVGGGVNKIELIGTATPSTTVVKNTAVTNWNNGTGFYMDASGRFFIGNSAGNKLTWDGSNLNVYGGGVFSGNLSAAGGSFSGDLVVGSGSTKLMTVGAGTTIVRLGITSSATPIWNNTNTSFYADNSGNFSLKDKLSFDGTTLNIFGGGTFTGALSGGTIDIGGADVSSFHVDAAGNMWMGNATFAGAPFSVSNTGGLVASGATINGIVTATTGQIGGWAIGATTLTGGTAILDSAGHISVGGGTFKAKLMGSGVAAYIGISSAATPVYNNVNTPFYAAHDQQVSIGNKLTYTGGVLTIDGAIAAGTIDIGGADTTSFHVDNTGNMWMGAATFGAAPFRVANTGGLVAQSATITGAITGASTLNIGASTAFHVGAGGDMWIGAATFAAAPFSVTAAGAVIANNITLTASITGGTIDIGGADATSFHVDVNGNMWMGNALYASAPFRVSNAGAILAQSGFIANWTINATSLVAPSSNIVMDASATPSIVVGATANRQIKLLSTGGTGPVLSVGQSGVGGYNTGGIFMGMDVATPRMSIGINKFRWDGANLFIDGNGTFSGTVFATSGSFSGTLTSTSATLGGWIVNTNQIRSALSEIVLDSTADTITVGYAANKIVLTGTGTNTTTSIKTESATNYLTGDGLWIDASGRMSLTGSVGSMAFDGTNLTVTGTIETGAGHIGSWQINNSTISGDSNKVILDKTGIISVGATPGGKITLTGGTLAALTTLTVGNTTAVSTGSGVFMDGAGNFSLGGATPGNGLRWNQGTGMLTVVGSGTFTGTIYASAGVFSGDISGAAGTFTGGINTNNVTINGGTISSSTYAYTPAGPYSTNGIQIDLGTTGFLRAKNFGITAGGDAYFKGTLGAGIVTAGALAVTTQGANLIANAAFQETMTDTWQAVEGSPSFSATIDPASGALSSNVLAITPVASAGVGSRAIPVVPGQKYRVSFTARTPASSTGTYTVRMNWDSGYADFITSAIRDGYAPVILEAAAKSGIASNTTPYIWEFTWTAPSTARWASLSFYNNSGTGTLYISNTSIHEQLSGVYIKDGAITADKVAANTITGNEISALTNITVGTGTYKGKIIGATGTDTQIGITSAATPVYGNANTPFYAGADNRVSVSDKLTWDGTNLNIVGGGTFSGNLTIGTGTYKVRAIGGSGTSTWLGITSAATPAYNNANTPFYAGADNNVSIANKLTYNGTVLNITGGVTASSFSLLDGSSNTVATLSNSGYYSLAADASLKMTNIANGAGSLLGWGDYGNGQTLTLGTIANAAYLAGFGGTWDSHVSSRAYSTGSDLLLSAGQLDNSPNWANLDLTSASSASRAALHVAGPSGFTSIELLAGGTINIDAPGNVDFDVGAYFLVDATYIALTTSTAAGIPITANSGPVSISAGTTAAVNAYGGKLTLAGSTGTDLYNKVTTSWSANIGSHGGSHLWMTNAAGNGTQIAMYAIAAGQAPIFQHNSSNGESFSFLNNGMSVCVPIYASAFTVVSSREEKVNVRSFKDKESSLDKIVELRSVVFDDKVGEQHLRKSDRFKDLDKRWQASGKSPLVPDRAKHMITEDHNCDLAECGGTSAEPCGIASRSYNRRGLIAEEVINVFPEAVQLDMYNKPIGIDYSVLVVELMEAVTVLTARVKELEANQ